MTCCVYACYMQIVHIPFNNNNNIYIMYTLLVLCVCMYRQGRMTVKIVKLVTVIIVIVIIIIRGKELILSFQVINPLYVVKINTI